jgi:phosphoglycolate phosphatase-like HAD superfamily hydrolase
MAKRKQTPDVLAEILGGEAANGTVLAVGGETSARAARLAATKQAAAAPQEWEYYVITFQDYKGWRPRYLDGREIKDWMSGPLIHEYLADLGSQGWELAAASAGERMYGNADNHQLYFKRPR